MSANARALAVNSYKRTATQAYQTSSKLRRAVMFDGGLEAVTHQFSVVGVGKAMRRSSQAQIAPANTPNKRPVITLESREYIDYLDENDQAITSVRLIRPYGMTAGAAVGRSVDDDIIGALNAWDANAYIHPGVTEANMTIASGTAGVINAKALAEGKGRLLDTMDDEDANNYFCAFPASSWDELVQETTMASADYVGGKVTETGMLSMRYGLRLIPIGARTDQGGALPANKAFIWHRNAIGLAETSRGNRSFVEWSVDRQSWAVGTKAICGAARIQAAGIVTVNLS